MKYNTLGRSEISVSEIGFGCMSLGENIDEHPMLLNRAHDMGINFFDTADIYQQGQNEISVGKALKSKRKEVVIATKVGNQLRNNGQGWDWNPGKDYILSAVNESLKRLQTDYIDLYQLHGGTTGDPMEETIEAFEILKKEGKIRHYGISSIRPNVIREYVRRSKIVSVMMQYSLLDRRPEESVLGLLQENAVGVLARGSLAKGLLVNKPATGYLKYSAEEVGSAAAAVRDASGVHRSSSQTAIRFALSNSAISSAVVGIRTVSQLDDAVHTSKAPALTADEIRLLTASLPSNTYEEHR